jgi:dihydrofolate reductase
MQVSVFVGTSLDGFLARLDNRFDFLPTDLGEPHGYEEFIATVDTIAIGRNTFDVVAAFPEWPYASKRVVVLTSRQLAPSKAPVERMSGNPASIIEQLGASGAKHVYVDGGITVQRFLRAGLVDRITITRLPILIGSGIPLFGPLDHDIKLRHESTRVIAGIAVQSVYDVLR